MNDTISRIRLLNRLKHRRYAFCKNRTEFLGLSKNDKARVDEMDACIAEVINAPTIEPEREKGKWIEEDDGWDGVWRCSECNEPFYLVDGTPVDNEYHYCPNCGADMRGDQNDEMGS